MQIKTILNRCLKFKAFVIEKVTMTDDIVNPALVVDIRPRRNSRPVCSRCETPGTVYDTEPRPRRFEWIPLLDFHVFFRYPMRRVDCKVCGTPVVERVEWADGKSPVSHSLALFLARWARRLSMSEVANVFGTSWHKVYQSMKEVVDYGMAHRSLVGVTALGVDEIHYRSGHAGFCTMVWQLDEGNRRLLEMEDSRKGMALNACLSRLGDEFCTGIRFVCTDMWQPFITCIRRRLPGALNILDRFHLVMNLNKAIDKVRAAEVRELKQQGFKQVLTHSKYCFLKRRENLTPKQDVKLRDLLRRPLKTVRAYLLKEDFQAMWEYSAPAWATWFLRKWCTRAMRSRLPPFRRYVKNIRKHEPLIINWFRAKKAFSNSITEGLNRQVNLVTRRAFGYRSFEVFRTALFHNLGRLPEPPHFRGFS